MKFKSKIALLAALTLHLPSVFAQIFVADIQDSIGGAPAQFYAQDLQVAKNNPAMANYANWALAQFQSKNGRAPQNDIEQAIAAVDWVSSNLRNPAFWPEDPSQPRLYTGAAYNYDAFNHDPALIIQAGLSNQLTDYANYKWLYCTYQNFAAAGIMNTFGIHARLVSVEGHDGLEFYSYSLHKWVWMDATFNEHYTSTNSDGSINYLGAVDLNKMTLAGTLSQATSVKHGVPTATFYYNTYINVHPRGFRQFAVEQYMNNFNGGGINFLRTDTLVYVPQLPSTFVPTANEAVSYLSNPNNCTDQSAPTCKWGLAWTLWPQTNSLSSFNYPIDGLYVSIVSHDINTNWAGFVRVNITSMLPYTTVFQARNDYDTNWTSIAGPATVSSTPVSTTINFGLGYWGVNSSKVHLRAVDSYGNTSKEVVFTPRASNI